MNKELSRDLHYSIRNEIMLNRHIITINYNFLSSYMTELKAFDTSYIHTHNI